MTGEVVSRYAISKKARIGLYYMYSNGSDGGFENGHFIMLNSGFSNIVITDQYYLNISPQFYYLILDEDSDVYGAAYVTFKNEKIAVVCSRPS